MSVANKLFFTSDEIKNYTEEEAEIRLESIEEKLADLGDVIRLTLGTSDKTNLNKYLDLKEEKRLITLHIISLQKVCQPEEMLF